MGAGRHKQAEESASQRFNTFLDEVKRNPATPKMPAVAPVKTPAQTAAVAQAKTQAQAKARGPWSRRFLDMVGVTAQQSPYPTMYTAIPGSVNKSQDVRQLFDPRAKGRK